MKWFLDLTMRGKLSVCRAAVARAGTEAQKTGGAIQGMTVNPNTEVLKEITT